MIKLNNYSHFLLIPAIFYFMVDHKKHPICQRLTSSKLKNVLTITLLFNFIPNFETNKYFLTFNHNKKQNLIVQITKLALLDIYVDFVKYFAKQQLC